MTGARRLQLLVPPVAGKQATIDTRRLLRTSIKYSIVKEQTTKKARQVGVPSPTRQATGVLAPRAGGLGLLCNRIAPVGCRQAARRLTGWSPHRLRPALYHRFSTPLMFFAMMMLVTTGDPAGRHAFHRAYLRALSLIWSALLSSRTANR